MVKEQLTGPMIDAGEWLTRKLDETGLPVTTALWFFDSELNEWRLLFASPEVGTKGSIEVYRRIQRAIDQLGDHASMVPLSVVGVLDTDSDLASLLRKGIHTGPGVSRIRFSRNVINGHFIDDALIYRAA